MHTHRVLALGGLAWTVLFLLSFSLAGEEPPATAAGADIQSYFADWPAAANILYALSVLGLIAYLAVVGAALLRSAETLLGAVALSGAVMFAALQAAGDIAFLSLTYHDPADLSDVQARSMLAFHETSHTLQSYPMAAFVASAGLVALRTGLLSRWLGWAGCALAAYLLVTGTPGLAGAADYSHGSEAQVVGFLLFLLWVGASSMGLARNRTPTSTRAAELHR